MITVKDLTFNYGKKDIFSHYNLFIPDGKFVDYFFLCFPDGVEPKRYQIMRLIIWKDYLFSVDQDREGYYSIAKYKIED